MLPEGYFKPGMLENIFESIYEISFPRLWSSTWFGLTGS